MAERSLYSLVKRPDRSFAKFWSRVSILKPKECWPWLGVLNNHGRGSFSIGAYRTTVGRVAWAFANGRLAPDDMDVCHRCDNGRCANPAHLYLASHLQNMEDYHRPRRMLNRSPSLPIGIRITPKGFQAYVYVPDRGGYQASKRFPFGTPVGEMVLWRQTRRLSSIVAASSQPPA